MKSESALMHEKWVGINILGLSALIFSALVTSPPYFGRYYSLSNMSALIYVKAKKLSALITLVHEKLVGLNILGELALIFSALVTGPN